jgi:adenylate cyclase
LSAIFGDNLQGTHMDEQRKLVAILAADIVGYSRLMEVDEPGTIARQKANWGELVEPTIAECGGRVVKLMGDGVLVEFASAVDSVRCAVALQQAMTERETDLPKENRIQFRVGINVGDAAQAGLGGRHFRPLAVVRLSSSERQLRAQHGQRL